MNRRPFLANGMVVIIGSVIGLWWSTYHYGNNFVSKTTPEAISDLTLFMSFLVGVILYTIGQALPKNPS